jgi:GNAT superfamily N-acetyltransferase
MEIILAQLEHLEEISKLFDRYRIFYKQSSDIAAATKFLQERFEQKDSTIFLALEADRAIGFTQLYPSFSSVSMRRIWILNDLFVEEDFRKKSVAKLLMSAAEKFARETRAVRIVLSTQIFNVVAQKLYESRGYIKDEEFFHYALSL